MRKLVILRGAMGVGKSTFIKENNLERFTLSADSIRLMFNAPEMNINYEENIPQFNNKKTWDLLFYVLEERMKKGEFTIVDAVHALANESYPEYKKLAEKYRYRLYVLDFTKVPKEVAYERNENRNDYKKVPKSSIDWAYKMFAKEKLPKAFKTTELDNFKEIISSEPIDYNSYEHIHIIGDIHGCYSALKKYFDKEVIKENDAYIFLGDYFDRGIENYQTFIFIEELMKNKNMYFLVGNHEDKLYKYACLDEFKMDYDIKNTILEFESNNLNKSRIRGFIKNLAQICYINFGEKTYLISHGGIPYFPNKPLTFYSTNSFIYGVDKYGVDIDKIYQEYMEKSNDKVYQIHGHRNFYKIKYDEYPYSLNLEGDIEHGGNLRVVTLNKDGSKDYLEVKNDVYNPNLIEETKVYNLVDYLRKSKYVYEKVLDNNICSFNFSKEAFYHRIWDDLTTKARGLFIDTNNYKIVARSYNKFFRIEERKETTLEELKESLVYPAKFYLKYNGFLGILSVLNNELYFLTKSSDNGLHVDYFKKIFYNSFNEEQIESIKKKLIEDNLSFVFEVIDNVNDPHIIKYDSAKIVLLDGVKNSTDFIKLDYDDLKNFAKINNIDVKEEVYLANNLEEFIDIYEIIISDDYKYNNKYVEGFVIEDNSGFMVKTKTAYYNKWKYLRNKMEYAIKNNDYRFNSKDKLEEEFLKYIENKYKDKDVNIFKINIINEREEFLKYYYE